MNAIVSSRLDLRMYLAVIQILGIVRVLSRSLLDHRRTVSWRFGTAFRVIPARAA